MAAKLNEIDNHVAKVSSRQKGLIELPELSGLSCTETWHIMLPLVVSTTGYQANTNASPPLSTCLYKCTLYKE